MYVKWVEYWRSCPVEAQRKRRRTNKRPASCPVTRVTHATMSASSRHAWFIPSTASPDHTPVYPLPLAAGRRVSFEREARGTSCHRPSQHTPSRVAQAARNLKCISRPSPSRASSPVRFFDQLHFPPHMLMSVHRSRPDSDRALLSPTQRRGWS